MNKRITLSTVLNIITIFLLLIVTICGICSFDTTHSYEIINQYGENIEMWGSGIYAHDSYFKATIFIGSDFTILVFIVPSAIMTFWKIRKIQSIENYIRGFGVLSVIMYYSTSIAFGVTYNSLHLLYIALFGISFYSVGFIIAKLFVIGTQRNIVCKYSITKGMKLYLIIAGVSLFVAWLPDIVTSLINGTSLGLIEIYTTEITYVLDMGIISPLMFLTLYLLNRETFMGYVLFRIILKVCICIGIMLPLQSVFQILGGISIPIPAIITKIMIFVMLAFFAVLFDYRLKQKTQYIVEVV